MVNNYVGGDHELLEVLNAFPFLEDKSEVLSHIESDIESGETIYDYFIRKDYSEDEIEVLIRKINVEIKSFLKNSSQKDEKIKNHEDSEKNSQSLGIDMI